MITTDQQKAVRSLHAHDPSHWTVARLARHFKVTHRTIRDLVGEPRPSRATNINRPQGKRATFMPRKRYPPDPRDATAQFFGDPLPHHITARQQQKDKTMEAKDALTELAEQLDIPVDKIRHYHNKWRAGNEATGEKEESAYAAFKADPTRFGNPRPPGSMPADLTNRGAGNFERNEPGAPGGVTR